METINIIIMTVSACAGIGLLVGAYSKLSRQIQDETNYLNTEISNVKSDLELDLQELHRQIDRRADQLLAKIELKADKKVTVKKTTKKNK
jgi:hypothetical protein|tara:strand:+ start:3101 stop:3370 length:270 start_codon:yes stop_codon:yes gene_type:complete